MQVKSIAEFSKGSILQYFRPSLSYHLPSRPLFCLFLRGRLRPVLLYITVHACLKNGLTHMLLEPKSHELALMFNGNFCNFPCLWLFLFGPWFIILIIVSSIGYSLQTWWWRVGSINPKCSDHFLESSAGNTVRVNRGTTWCWILTQGSGEDNS